MDDLDRLILETYQSVLFNLRDNPAELAARLARRKTAALTGPPRAWCLAVRASDTRIDNDTAVITPYQALHSRTQPLPHHVTLDHRLLQTLCQPVELLPNMDWTDVARALGVHPESLRHSMNSGRFRLHHYKRLGGKRGKPVPVFLNFESLDPSSGRHRQPPDTIWGQMWRRAADRVPKDFEQTLARRPAFAAYDGAPRFRGYRWLCPRCEKLVRIVYCPLPPYSIPRYMNFDPASLLHDPSVSPQPSPSPAFACHHCHRVSFYTRTSRDSWNQFITHATAGLLYGHEVPKPADFNAPDKRKRPYRPILNRPPSPRRQQVLQLLLDGHTYDQIAHALHVGRATVHGHVKTLYKQHNVHSRRQLSEQLNRPPLSGAPASHHRGEAGAAP